MVERGGLNAAEVVPIIGVKNILHYFLAVHDSALVVDGRLEVITFNEQFFFHLFLHLLNLFLGSFVFLEKLVFDFLFAVDFAIMSST